jgi:hypothetical protein
MKEPAVSKIVAGPIDDLVLIIVFLCIVPLTDL